MFLAFLRIEHALPHLTCFSLSKEKRRILDTQHKFIEDFGVIAAELFVPLYRAPTEGLIFYNRNGQREERRKRSVTIVLSSASSAQLRGYVFFKSQFLGEVRGSLREEGS